jgi:hypothetical protein
MKIGTISLNLCFASLFSCLSWFSYVLLFLCGGLVPFSVKRKNEAMPLRSSFVYYDKGGQKYNCFYLPENCTSLIQVWCTSGSDVSK